jgi:glutamate/tyrosine decarboxylase-like PLP-dependent enzyme
VALHARGDAERGSLVLYASGEAHSSVGRAARVVGVPVHEVAVDREQRIDLAELERAVASDLDAGRRPFCVVASAGTTGTGAVDPLRDLRTRCDAHGMWLHVDGAYGAPAAICASARPLFDGLELADSVTVDPHKWMFQTPELGCLLVREGHLLPETFAVSPAYLRDAAAGSDEVNFSDRGINLTRQFSALKLWMSLKVYGAAAFRDAIERCLGLAEHAQRVLEADARWEVVTPAQLGIVTFRLAGGASADARTRALVPALTADGLAVLSSTDVHGRVALRMCTDNPRTTREDVEATLGRLGELADQPAG